MARTPLIPRLELSFHSFADAAKVMEPAVRNDWPDDHNDYVVMLSREEDLYIVNFMYAPHSDRNRVVFMERDAFDEDYVDREYLAEDTDNDV